MLRRLFALGALCALLAGVAPRPAAAQPTAAPTRTYTIYMILFRGETDIERGFRDYLAAQGIRAKYIVRNVKLDPKAVPALIPEIRRLKPDLVYTFGTPVTLNVVGTYDKPNPKKFIANIPVVFTLVSAPVGVKIVPKLESSGRNVTGVSNVVGLRQQFQAMAGYHPYKRVAMLYASNAKNSVFLAKEAQGLAEEMGFTLDARPFALDKDGKPTTDGIAATIHDMKSKGADWLYLGPDTFLGEALPDVMPAADREKLATFGSTEQMMDAGALAGIICRYYSLGQLTAYKAQEILVQGKKPADIPVETLTRYTYVVRLPLARKLGLLPPLELFDYAEIVTTPAKLPKKKKAA